MNENQKTWFTDKKKEVESDLETSKRTTVKYLLFYNVLLTILFGLCRYSI